MEFKAFAEHLESIAGVDSRLAKTSRVTNLLRETGGDETTLLFLQGRIYPAYAEEDVGMASKLVAKSIAASTGHSETEITDAWRERGDLGEVAQAKSLEQQQMTLFSETYTVQDVHQTFKDIAKTTGDGSIQTKIQLLAKLLNQTEGVTAKYIVRLALQDLRIGIGEGTLRDAIAWSFVEEANPNYDEETESINPESREAYQATIDAVQNSLDKTNDFYGTVQTAKNGLETLRAVTVTPGKPVKSMLAQRAKTLEEGFERAGKPCAFEYKYDGMRMQIHKTPEAFHIYTRSLEDVTEQFPEVKEAVYTHVDAATIVLDCEAVGYDAETERYMPFQHISQRIKRKYDIQRLSQELPVEIQVFDVFYQDGSEVLEKPYKERRKIIEKHVENAPKKIHPSKQRVTSSLEEAQAFFNDAKTDGQEGLIIKNVDSPYQPGNRVGHMLKYKATMDDVDGVIVKAEWGQGKRSGWLTSFTIAVRNEDEYDTVGKVATGLKEKPEEGFSFKELTEALQPNIVEQDGRNVEIAPKHVISVRFEEIQESPAYTSGYALRFPRFVAYRPDRSPQSATTLEEIEAQYESQ